MVRGIPGNGNCKSKGLEAGECWTQYDGAGLSSGQGEQGPLPDCRPHKEKPQGRNTWEGLNQEVHEEMVFGSLEGRQG